jgi:type 1 glutamine amidotransferase
MPGKRILIILGGTYHDFDGFAEAMTPVLEGTGHSVAATYNLDDLLSLSEGGFDLVLSYTSFSRHREGRDDSHPESLTAGQTEALVEWVRGGGGMLAVHSATVSGAPNADLTALLGGRFVEHPPRFAFPVVPMHREHPITHNVETFCVHDELYIQEVAASVSVHMVALDRGVAHPMVWTRCEGRGRVAHVAMGHSEEVWAMEPYRRLILQSIDWATE